MESRTFAPRKNFRSIRVPLLVLPLFIAACIFAGTRYGRPGWAAAGFFSFLLLLLVAEAAGWWCTYRVDSSGVFARRWYKRRLFGRSEIHDVEELTSGQAQERLQPSLEREADGVRGMDFSAQMTSRREIGRYTTFCSVPIAYTETRSGGPRSVVAVGARTFGEFVEMTLTNGERYLLSPADSSGFVGAVRRVLGGS